MFNNTGIDQDLTRLFKGDPNLKMFVPDNAKAEIGKYGPVSRPQSLPLPHPETEVFVPTYQQSEYASWSNDSPTYLMSPTSPVNWSINRYVNGYRPQPNSPTEILTPISESTISDSSSGVGSMSSLDTSLESSYTMQPTFNPQPSSIRVLPQAHAQAGLFQEGFWTNTSWALYPPWSVVDVINNRYPPMQMNMQPAAQSIDNQYARCYSRSNSDGPSPPPPPAGRPIVKTIAVNTNFKENIKHLKQQFCGFCRSNGEAQELYLNHMLRDMNGNVTCPVLRAHQCEVCGESGNKAHTKTYCPKVIERFGHRPQSVAVALKNTEKRCDGRVRRNRLESI